MKLLLALCLVSTSAFPMKMELELLPGEGNDRCVDIVKYSKALTMLKATGIEIDSTPHMNEYDIVGVQWAIDKKKTVEDVAQACLTRGPDQFVDALK